MRSYQFCAAIIAVVGLGPLAASGGLIDLSDANMTATPGQTVSALVLIEEDAVPLLGYSLDINILPTIRSTGSITANIALTNFFPTRNLFLAAGKTLDATFSVVTDPGDGGVFINAIAADLSTVLPTPGVNDVLAEVFFDISPDAAGDFVVQLGPATALADANSDPISFSFTPATITVVPEPATAAVLVLTCVAGYSARRRIGNRPSR